MGWGEVLGTVVSEDRLPELKLHHQLVFLCAAYHAAFPRRDMIPPPLEQVKDRHKDIRVNRMTDERQL